MENVTYVYDFALFPENPNPSGVVNFVDVFKVSYLEITIQGRTTRLYPTSVEENEVI